MLRHAVSLIILISLISCSEKEKSTQKNEESGNTAMTFTNPIFPGDHPDPSILRDGDDFYMVHSSFEYYPGLLIWHSTDLINWEPVGPALTEYVGSVWAPDLVKYEDKYYVYFPADNKNYVVSADNIEGPWSDPVLIDITMIDPGHVVDEQGNRYLYFSSGSYVPLSKDGLTVTGEPKNVYDGWEIPREWSIECFCMEGPKLFKRGDYYYLTVAEGGTAGPATGHMVISARSKSPLGPWENAPHNPILRTASQDERWWSVGHGTVFDDAEGNWYMIFHGYEKDHYNMGRQTMLVPLEWSEDDWYRIPENISINEAIPLPDLENTIEQPFTLDDDFSGNSLKPQWRFFGGVDEERYHFEDDDLVLDGKGNSVADASPMLTVPLDHSYTAQVEMEIGENAIGGLVLFYNERAFSGILTDGQNILSNLRGWQFPTEENVVESNSVYLRLKNTDNIVDMYYSLDGQKWIKTANSFDVSGYHHNVLSGFMSVQIGLCAIGEGQVTLKDFEYIPN